MQKTFPYFFIGFIIFLTLFSCANQGTLTGGKEDKTAPIVNSEKSTPNYQTNFKKQTIEFAFDEWVQLKDVFKQVVVSPPLRENFDVSLKRKSVLFKFHEDEVLRENATYTINFGSSVQDLTERNPVEDLRFVFSTGDVIDSLEVSGNVVDAFDKEPIEGVLVMLYDNLSDTVVRKDKPFYFGKTDEDGNFIIKNVRADTFKTFALIDGNSNYLFDNESEKIGFLSEPVVLTDSTELTLELQMFEQEPKLQLQGEDKKKYGRIGFGFNRKPNDGETKITSQDVGQKSYLQNVKDSLVLWYDVPQDTSWRVYVQTDTLTPDTIKIPKLSRSKFFKNKKFELARASAKMSVHPTKPFSIAFKYPLGNIDTSLISILVDTLLQKVTPSVNIDSNDRTQLLIQYPFKEKTPYQLEFLPNAITDLFGSKNDSIIQILETKPKTDYGDLTLTVIDMQVDKSYVLELLDKSDAVIETIPMSGDTIFKKVFKTIETGKYSVRMIIDNNGNEKWDTGNYDNNSQPEPLFTRTLEEVRAGWEVDATVSADEKAKVKIEDDKDEDDEDTESPPVRPKSDVPKPGGGKN